MRLIDCRPKPQSLDKINRSGSIVPEREPDELGYLLGALDLQRAVTDHAERDLLVLGYCSADVFEVQAVVERALEGDDIHVELIEIRQRVLVGLIATCNALGGGAAPTGVAPNLAFAAQACDLVIERLDPLGGRDRRPRVGDHLMDGRLLNLHNRRAGVGQRVVLAVESGGEVEQQLQPVPVMLVRQHQREDLR